ncbi:kinase-like protein [Xylariaceae sp. FL1019]|nr:kinase-like protein [Xylariaceae sp. FL1019]
MDPSDDSLRSGSTEDDVQSISRSSQGHSPQDQAATLPDSQDEGNLEGHRNMMLASLLEDYYRNRALEFLNTTDPDQGYTRQSPEVQIVARRLFEQASQLLSSNGLLPSTATSDESRTTRHQYLAGLDSLVAGSQAPNALGSMRDLVAQASQLKISDPTNDLQLTLHQPTPARSHYKSSFREDCLLGRGGFGKVYQCYNLLDQKTYAVKKILLSPKLVKNFCDGKHDELQHILREVKAMAMLDHPNVVRYHATWFEEPQQPPAGVQTALDRMSSKPQARRQQLLLDSRPFDESSNQSSLHAPSPEPSAGNSIVFGEDTLSNPSLGRSIVFGADSTPELEASIGGSNAQSGNLGWSEADMSDSDDADSASGSESNIFTDGRTNSEPAVRHASGPEGYTPPALYIQMSMYPMSLAQFLSPTSSRSTGLRHCFHLAPTLRLLSSIHDGLQYIHSKGLIHRDIKPGNIFLSAPGADFDSGSCNLSCKICANPDCGETRSPSQFLNPRIGDFGLVHQLAHGDVPGSSPSSSESQKGAGTTYYQPPDIGEKNEKIDIFALGVVFTEMLCRCDTAMERARMLMGLQEGELPPGLEKMIKGEGHEPKTADLVLQLLSSMIEKDAKQRWSGSQVREALRDLLGRCKD